MALNESDVEQAVLEWFEGMGYVILHGPDIAPGEVQAERAGYVEMIKDRPVHHKVYPW